MEDRLGELICGIKASILVPLMWGGAIIVALGVTWLIEQLFVHGTAGSIIAMLVCGTLVGSGLGYITYVWNRCHC